IHDTSLWCPCQSTRKLYLGQYQYRVATEHQGSSAKAVLDRGERYSVKATFYRSGVVTDAGKPDSPGRSRVYVVRDAARFEPLRRLQVSGIYARPHTRKHPQRGLDLLSF